MAKLAHRAGVSPVKMCMGGRTPAPARTAPRPARAGGAQAQQGRLAAWGCGRGDFDWAAGIVHSRCFATRVGGRPVRLAVPGVDMCNHAAEPSAHVRCGAARARPPDAARKPCGTLLVRQCLCKHANLCTAAAAGCSTARRPCRAWRPRRRCASRPRRSRPASSSSPGRRASGAPDPAARGPAFGRGLPSAAVLLPKQSAAVFSIVKSTKHRAWHCSHRHPRSW